MSMTAKDFEQNIRRIKQGDKDGLKAVYEAYLPMVYSQVYVILQNRQNAEDVTSEFFIKLWSIAGQYQEGAGHKAWLLTIARNMAIDFIRRNTREELTGELLEESWAGSKTQEEQICEKMTLKQALDTLEEEERQIIDLKIMGELTFKEISQLLKKPLGTIAWRYRTALGKLKRCRYE